MYEELSKSDLVRKVRPLQRIVAPLIIEDVVSGRPPASLGEAYQRYTEFLNDHAPEGARQYAAGPSEKGDIREFAIEWLIKNGFGKGKAVSIDEADVLTNWLSDRDDLEIAADLEIEHGSNRVWAKLAREMRKTCKRYGSGLKAVYVYTDSRLDQLGDTCTKIGSHHHSGMGDVAGRIAQQYKTGNPGVPVLRFVFAVDDASALETYLHRHFKNSRIKNGVGKEWFEVCADDVKDVAVQVIDNYYN